MDYSFTPYKRFKQYNYIRYSIQFDRDFEEIVYCKNDVAFLEFLNEMNNKNIWSKFYTKKDWDEQKSINEIMMKESEMDKYRKHLNNILRRRGKNDPASIGSD